MKIENVRVLFNGTPAPIALGAANLLLAAAREQKTLADAAKAVAENLGGGAVVSDTADAAGLFAVKFEVSDSSFVVMTRVIDKNYSGISAKQKAEQSLLNRADNALIGAAKDADRRAKSIKAILDAGKKYVEKHGQSEGFGSRSKMLKSLLAALGRNAASAKALTENGVATHQWFVYVPEGDVPQVFRRTVPVTGIEAADWKPLCEKISLTGNETVERWPKGSRPVSESEARQYLSQYEVIK